MELFVKLIFFINVGIAFCAKDYKKTSGLAGAVFKFIYNNEKLCGDMFSNSTWFPARHNCELRCRIDTEICQMSSDAMPIRRQRCHGLPAECRRHLKKLVGGAELYTKPNKRRNPAVEKQKKSSANSTKNALKAHIKPLLNSTNPSHQIRTNASATHKPPLAELVPLVQDLNEILIHPAQFHTTALPVPAKRITTKKSLVKPLPAPAFGQPFPTTMPRPKHLPSPVDDSLQRMFEQLYIEANTTWSAGGDGDENSTTITTTSAKASSLSSTSTVDEQQNNVSTPLATTTTAAEAQTGTATASSSGHEWQSAELFDQPFAGNPFGVANSSSAEGENVTITTNNGDRAIQAAAPQLGPVYKNEVFGPPLNPIVINYEQQLHTERSESTSVDVTKGNSAPSDVFVHASTISSIISSSSSSTTTRLQMNNNIVNMEKNDMGMVEKDVLKTMPKTLEEVEKRQIPWWNWREFAEAFRQRPFYHGTSSVPSSGDETGDILSLDKSVRCCHWALEGLCDRSWQRVRELCPKSCGSLVCSSIDGTLSCSRAINVDVIACYEQRRRQHLRPPLKASTKATPSDTVTTVAAKRNLGATFERETVTEPPEESDRFGKSADRAFAVENEMKMFMESTKRSATVG